MKNFDAFTAYTIWCVVAIVIPICIGLSFAGYNEHKHFEERCLRDGGYPITTRFDTICVDNEIILQP